MTVEDNENHYGNRCFGKSYRWKHAKTIMGTGVWGKANPEKHAKSSMGTSIWAKLSYKNIAKAVWEQVFLGS